MKSHSASEFARATRDNIVFSFLSEFSPIYPAYMILFKDRGYGFAELSLLFVVWELSVVVLELPTGILADRWDKRRALALGMVLKALGFLAWLLSPSFAAAAIGFALWGAQEAFCSGARQALLYETLSSAGLESDYAKASGVSNAASTSAVALSLLIGGAIYAASPGLTLSLSAAAGLAGAASALRIRQGRSAGRRPSTSHKLSARGAGYSGEASLGFGQQATAFFKTLKRTRMLAFMALASVAIASSGTLDEFDGLWAMERYGVPLAWVGVWGAVRFGAEALGGLAGGFLAGRAGTVRRGRIAISIGLAGAGFVAAALLVRLLGVPLYIGAYAIMAAVGVAAETKLQEVVSDEGRAAVLSFSSLFMTLCAMALAPVLGAAGDKGGLRAIMALGGLVILAAALLLGGAGMAAALRSRTGRRGA